MRKTGHCSCKIDRKGDFYKDSRRNQETDKVDRKKICKNFERLKQS